MRKIAAIAASAVLAVALAGCASGGSSSASSASSASSSAASSASFSSLSESAASASQSSASTANWVPAKGSIEAAEGAGISTFIMPDRTVLADITFTDPTYSYADKGGVAQAKYEQGAAELTIRKADGSHTAPLTDTDTATLAATWTKTYQDLEVTCYGEARGAAAVVEWKDDTKEYAVTIQGLGGETLALDSEDVDDIVRAVKATDVAVQPQEQQTQQQDQSHVQNYANISEANARQAAEGASGGTTTSAYQANIDGHGMCWVVTTQDANGNVTTYYVDQYGNPYNAEFDTNSSTETTLTEDQAAAAAEGASGGKTTSAYVVQTENHGMCWYVTTVDAEGNTDSYYVDNGGNPFNADFD